MTTAHAFCAPSAAYMWRHCALAPTMGARYPEPSTDESTEGDAAHWCNVQPEPTTAHRAPNGVQVTEAMLRGRGIWHRAAIATGVQQWNIEQRLPHGPFGPHVWGTPDLWGITGNTLHVLDYKFGHEQVEAFENLQLMIYVALILASLGVSDLDLSVCMTIVQPRGYHKEGPVRTWRVARAADLRADWNILRAAAERATQPEPRGTPGVYCKHCPGRRTCDALQRSTWRGVDMSGESSPIQLQPHELAYELREVRRAIKLLQARETGLAAQATAHIMAGDRVPGFVMEPTKPRERWLVPPATVRQWGQAYNLALTKEEPITPQQARELGMPAAIVNTLSERPRGSLTLVEDDGSFTRKAFSNGK